MAKPLYLKILSVISEISEKIYGLPTKAGTLAKREKLLS